MDLVNYIATNFNGTKNLGAALAGSVYFYVGDQDDYYLNEGVDEFRKRTGAMGSVSWANVTVLQGKRHGVNYQAREIWDYLGFLERWIKDHVPDGKAQLINEKTSPATRGNLWSEVVASGGRAAAIARQASPSISIDAAEGAVQVGTEI